MSDYQSHLVRTSSLDPDFIRNNLSVVNTPVKLLFERDTMSMTKDWTEEEIKEQRRLVKFEFVKLSASDYLVKFRPIPKSEFTNDAAIISCIFWKEKELHIVTSVDIILLLEYLIQQSFSIEEKNRIRRNLQSLRPLTISRSNKNYQRFFQLLMSMEDPRPRNIEKDLKVFKWSDLFSALNKVVSKYSSSTLDSLVESSIAPEKAEDLKKSPLTNPAMLPNSEPSSTNSSVINEDLSFLPSERLKVMKKKTNIPPNYSNNNLYASNNLQVKHKAYQDGIAPSNPIPYKQQHRQNQPPYLTPIPQGRPLQPSGSLGHVDGVGSGNPPHAAFANAPLPAPVAGGGPEAPKADKAETDSESNSGTEESAGSGSLYGIASSEEQESKSANLKNSNSVVSSESIRDDPITSSEEASKDDIGSTKVRSGSAPSDSNLSSSSSKSDKAVSSRSVENGVNGIHSYGFGNNSFPVTTSGSGTGSGSGSVSLSGSGSGSRGSGLFSNANKGISSHGTGISTAENSGGASKNASSTKMVGDKPRSAKDQTNRFAQDQSDRIFGTPVHSGNAEGNADERPYYQYPDASQIHYMNIPPIAQPPPAKNTSVPQLNNTESPSVANQPSQKVQRTSLSNPSQDGIKLPSLEQYFTKTAGNNNEHNVKLPPIVNNHHRKQRSVPDISNPEDLVRYSKP